MNYSKGNALFLILIAVALFAALSYAITNSSRGGGNLDKEQQMIDNAVNEQCVASVEYGENKLKIINGCSVAELSYELSDGTNENPSNPSDTSCFLFHRDGAGVIPCGSYLDPTIPVGNITTGGDTTTIVLLSTGAHIKCGFWGGGDTICYVAFSADGGATFTSHLDECISTGSDGRTPSTFRSALADEICSSSCGGNQTQVGGAGSGAVTTYIENNYTGSAYSGACTARGMSVRCDCW
tara:strand:- start:4 stop:720 length:717 start_codon:yes stop_codon:yes gene_type:complete